MRRGRLYHILSDTTRLTVFLAYSNFFAPLAYTNPSSETPLKTFKEVSLGVIGQIESSGRADAVGDHGKALGLYQIHPVVVQEYNQFNCPKKACFEHSDMLRPEAAGIVARWYLHVRIPAMLKYFKKPVETRNVIWAYNAGIGSVVRGTMPPITRAYIAKYERMVAGA